MKLATLRDGTQGENITLSLADDKTDPATGVSAMKDFIGQGYKIIAGAVSSGVALQEAPIAAQNQVLFISGPAQSSRLETSQGQG